jgi:hypothetical protein
VILKFENKHGRMTFPCDTYTAWADNLRAIALTLQSLRDVERYGATYEGEQYKGWTALPTDTNADPLTKAAMLIVNRAGNGYTVQAVTASRDALESAYRAAMHNVHPDKPGGSNELAQAVNAAREQIRKAKGWQ